MRLQAPSSIPTGSARAFTLLEIIVVVAILALLATMIVPKLTGHEKRAFKLAVDQVGDFLTMYAQRQTLGQKVVGIGRSGNSITLMQIDSDPGAAHTGHWRLDPTVKPVVFPDFMRAYDVDLIADGDRVDATQWPLSCEIGQERPVIQIDLRGAGEFASLTLYPYGVSPVMVSGYANIGTMRAKIDLDNTGQGRTDW